MDHQQPSTSRGGGRGAGGASEYHGEQGNRRTHAGGQARTDTGRVIVLRGGLRGGERALDIDHRYEPPAVPILDKLKVLKCIKPVHGFEGGFADIEFETNAAFNMKEYVLIEWFVGRATFKGHERQDKNMFRGTKHSIRTLLDQSMDGPILAYVYSVAYDRLVPEFKLWSRCRVIPLQNYAEISREHQVRPSRFFRSHSAITRRSRSKPSERSKSVRRRSPTPQKKGKKAEKCTPQEYARAILMPNGSFGLYDNCPEDLNWQPRNDMLCCHTENTAKKCSPRPKQPQCSPGTVNTAQMPPVPNLVNGNRPRRQLPSIPIRNNKRLLPQDPVNKTDSPQRWQLVLNTTERRSRSPQRGEIFNKPHSASPQRGEIMHTLTVPHRRYRSLSPGIRAPTYTVGTQTNQKRKPYCDCWRRGGCEECLASDDMLHKMLTQGNMWYCTCMRAWYKVSHEYQKISEGIKKLNMENR